MLSRRLFFFSGIGALASLAFRPKFAVACNNLDENVYAESTLWFKYMHFHKLEIPLAALISPPADGLKVKTSNVDQSIFDPGLAEIGLANHDHKLLISATELERIASGEKNVALNAYLKDGRVTHKFLVSAPGSIVAKVKKARQG